MKVEKTELIGMFEALQPGLATKEIVEHSTSFIFAEGDAMTCNDEVAVRCALPDGLRELEGAVEAAPLHSLLTRASKDNEIEVEVGKKHLVLRMKNSKAGLPLQREVSVKVEKYTGEWTALPKGFCEAVNFCLFSASKDMTNPSLVCIHISPNGFIESCDNYRLTRYRLGKDAKDAFAAFEEGLLIPAAHLRLLSNYAPTKFAVKGPWVHFKAKNGTTYSCRRFKDTFPNTDKLLSVDGIKIRLPDDLPDAIERAGIFTATEFEKDERVNVIVKSGWLVISGKGPSGWYKERAEIDYDGESVAFDIHPEFLRQTVSLLSDVCISKKYMKLEGENFDHVARLLVPEEDED